MNKSRSIPDHVLHDILPFVARPSRYTGGERGTLHKEFDKCRARIALAFPDVYEIGSGNLGQEILYHIVNARDEYVAERVYAPWDDFETILKQNFVGPIKKATPNSK